MNNKLRLNIIAVILCLMPIVNMYGQETDSTNKSEFEYNITINHSLPQYLFKILISTDTNLYGEVGWVSRIEVRRSDKKGIFQIIKPIPEARPFWPGAFVTKDLNFDGFLDLMLEYDFGSAGSWYRVWLYNPKTGKYNYNKVLSELCNVSPDNVSHTLISSEQSGAGNSTSNVYKYVRGKLIHISEENIWFDENIKQSIRESKLFYGNRKKSIRIDTLK